jgi:hypothetical protein
MNGLLPVPVSIQAQPGSSVGTGKSLSVEASFDGGKTWTRVQVIGLGNDRVALIQHPKGHGFVALRGKAVSTSGSTVEQTILKAYKF